MGGVSDDVLTARAFLSRVAEPACIPLWVAVCRDGPVMVADSIRAGTAAPAVLEACAPRAAHTDPYADLEAADRRGIRLVVPEANEWPHFALSCLEAAGARRATAYQNGQTRHCDAGEPIPPLALWVRGTADLAALGVRSVGIVGSRAATSYGEQVAADLAGGLAARGVVVVSGGAYGIDAAAHRGALQSAGETVIVSAGGVDRAYPPSNARLFERAAKSGLILSESPPGAVPQRRRFLTRNRLIAALATGTVVVEAAARSGAKNTARHCSDLGRPVMAVPGPVTSIMSAGCHELLSAEAHRAYLVTSVSDVLAVIGGSSDLGAYTADGSDTGADDLRSSLDTLESAARQVFDGLPARRAASVDELAVASGLATVEVIRALPGLEIAGLAESVEGGYRISPFARRRVGRAGAPSSPSTVSVIR